MARARVLSGRRIHSFARVLATTTATAAAVRCQCVASLGAFVASSFFPSLLSPLFVHYYVAPSFLVSFSITIYFCSSTARSGIALSIYTCFFHIFIPFIIVRAAVFAVCVCFIRTCFRRAHICIRGASCLLVGREFSLCKGFPLFFLACVYIHI